MKDSAGGAAPRTSRLVRAMWASYICVRPLGASSCEQVALMRDDPRMAIPSWLLNYLTSVGLPRTMRAQNKACEAWARRRERTAELRPQHEFMWLAGTTLAPPPVGGAAIKKDNQD